VGVLGLYGRNSASLAATLSGALTTPFGAIPFARSDSISDAVTGFGDIYPLATLRAEGSAPYAPKDGRKTCSSSAILPCIIDHLFQARSASIRSTGFE
jgi:hypothetical protein